MSRKKKLKAIELFAGAGGMALGLQMAGIDVVGLVEIDELCLHTLAANQREFFPKARIIKADLSSVSGRELLSRTGVRKGQLDILSGGPPCQGFTFASSRRSIDDPRSQMVWHFIRLVGEIKPKYFVMENVPGLFSFKDFFIELLREFEAKGYVVRFNMLDACSYGVPQRRLRVFIEGARSDLKTVPVFAAPTHFDLEKDKGFPPASLVAIKCFAVNGFAKEQVKDVWFNKKLEIMMDKKTATEQVERAMSEVIFETALGQLSSKTA